MYKSAFISLLIFWLALSFYSCDNDLDDAEATGNWIERSDFDGSSRSSGISFVIGDYVYVGLGYDGDNYLRDLWRYSSENNSWLRVDSFPGSGRTGAVAFAIDDKGYVGTGYNGDDALKDFYMYDPNSGWSQIADFPGTARYGAVAFAIAGDGYVGTGYDGSQTKDFWKLSGSSLQWEVTNSIEGDKREYAFSFVINDRAYVGSGRKNGYLLYDLWEFNPESQRWSALADLNEDEDNVAIARYGASTFEIDDKGYLTCGNNGSNTSSTWQYNPVSDTWVQMNNLEGTIRVDALGFSVNNRGYIATGKNGTSYFDDIWELRPKEELDEDD